MSYKCLSQKKLKEYTKGVIVKIGKCDSVKNSFPEDFDFFVNYLFTRHPNYPKKIDGLNDVIIKHNNYGNLSVYFKKINGHIEDISALNKCIKGQNKDDLYDAMRNSIIPQITEYRNSHSNLICDICESIDNIEIDHKEPHFIDLFSNFINEQQYKPTKFTSDKYHRKIFTREDKYFNDEWINYHMCNCVLRPLCKKCNSSRVNHKRNIEF
jgi:hypothetical protein